MRASTLICLLGILLLSSAVYPWEPVDGCKLDGGSTALSGDSCPPLGEWRQVTFSVTARCRNSCTGGTWSSASQAVTEATTLSCDRCPLVQRCTDCVNVVSRQKVEFYTEVERQDQTLFSGCRFRSRKRAIATCFCAGCGGPTPIVISLGDDIYELTSASEGVRFDLDGDGRAEQTAWTAAESDEGFLALDRNRNGRIDNLLEIFGDHTPQLPSDEPNGWRALAVWDDSLNGGNEDGRIDANDLIFKDLLIWVDRNHNGVSEAAELSTLEDSGLRYLSLDYDPDKSWVDDLGNGYRFPSTVVRSDESTGVVWDVFFALPVDNGS